MYCQNPHPHFATLSKSFEEDCFDGARIWNLDESVTTAGRDVDGRPSCRYLLRRRRFGDMKAVELNSFGRVTIMPCINAGGDAGPTL